MLRERSAPGASDESNRTSQRTYQQLRWHHGSTCQYSYLRIQENVYEHHVLHSGGKAVSKERKHQIMQSETLRKGQVFEVPATIVTFLAIAADTGGAFSLFEGRVAPQQGIPLHRHSDDEAFLVLEGTFQFQIEEQNQQLGPVEFAFVPMQTPHRYLNNSSEKEGRLLVITLPAGAHEGFFAEIGELKADASGPFSTMSPDIEKIMTVGKRYGIEILPQ
jgi:quercetin dioxygenase-like cupin family protein